MLLNFSFKIEFLLLKDIVLADGLSRLIPKNTESLGETIIASLKSEINVKYVLFNTVTFEEIKFKSKFNKVHYTKKKKKKE